MCPDGTSMEPGAVTKSPRGPLPATVQHPAGRLLPVQRSGRRLVSPELGAALPVPMWRTGLPVKAVVAAWTRGQTLGDVLCVGGWASLAGATADDTEHNTCHLSVWQRQQDKSSASVADVCTAGGAVVTASVAGSDL